VVIPYVEHLTFPDRWLRTRRDHERFLCLIEVIAFLHQHQRPKKSYQGTTYIEATSEDYRWAYKLARAVLQNSLDELSRWARVLVELISKYSQPLTRREIRELLRWPDNRTRDALAELVQLEFLDVQRGPNNLHIYQPLELFDEAHWPKLGLLTPDELEKRLKA
jgi:DNA primase